MAMITTVSPKISSVNARYKKDSRFVTTINTPDKMLRKYSSNFYILNSNYVFRPCRVDKIPVDLCFHVPKFGNDM